MGIKYLLEEIFPYLVLLYLIDCVTLGKTYEILFVSHFQRFKIKIPGLHLIDLSPLGETFSCFDLPLWFTRDGLYFPAKEGHHENEGEASHFLAFHEMEKVEADGRTIRINEKRFIDMPSAMGAIHIVQMICQLRDLDPAKRHEGIRILLEGMTNPAQVRGLRAFHAHSFFVLKIVSSLLFMEAFILLPLVLYSKSYPYLNFQLLLFVMGANYLLAVALAYSLRSKIYGKQPGQKISVILPMILSPICAIHIGGKLTREIYSRLDYHAVAGELLSSKDLFALMRKDLHQINCQKAQSNNEELIKFLSLKENVLYDLLNRRGVTAEQLWAPPERQCETAASFCPICRCEYRAGFQKCNDCGVELREFGSASSLGSSLSPGYLPIQVTPSSMPD